jgi:hypothetical protein
VTPAREPTRPEPTRRDPEMVDLATLREVERLLTTTNFVPADELVARDGAVPVPPPDLDRVERVADPTVVSSNPLPHRR